MKAVVTDSNVFVVFFRCDLLIRLLSTTSLEIHIPLEIYKELTEAGRRIPREYYGIPSIITQATHGFPNPQNTKIILTDVRENVNDVNAIEALFKLIDDNDLDLGEIEAIPLAIELKSAFVSNDEEAINELNNTYRNSGAVGKITVQFLEELKDLNVITSEELIALKRILNE